MGGIVSLIYSAEHEEQVAGIAFIDSSHYNQIEYFGEEYSDAIYNQTEEIKAGFWILEVINRLGLLNLAEGFLDSNTMEVILDDDAKKAAAYFGTWAPPFDAIRSEGDNVKLSFEQGKKAHYFRGDLPIVSISASDEIALVSQIDTGFSKEETKEIRKSFHKELADLSENGRYVIVNGTNHMSIIQHEETAGHILSLFDKSLFDKSLFGCPDEINLEFDTQRRIVSCGANPPQAKSSILEADGNELEDLFIKKTELETIFQGKPLDYWKSLDFNELREYGSQTEGDKFYYKLGEVIAKEFFESELVKQGIINENDFINIYTGTALLPDPPIIGYNAVINATDGFTYIMQTSVNGNIIGEYLNIQRLFFEPHILRAMIDGTEPIFINKFGETPTVQIVTEDEDDKLYPHQVIIDFDQTDSVIFANDSNGPVRIQGIGENKISSIPDNVWRTDTIMPGDDLSVQFNSTGYYKFYVKKITSSYEEYLDHHASGRLVVFTESMTDYTFEDGLLMGRVFVQDAPKHEIPWQSMGAGNPRGLEIGIVESVKHAIPNVEGYYLTKAKPLIPFDVKVIIE